MTAGDAGARAMKRHPHPGSAPEVICFGEAMALFLSAPGIPLSMSERFTVGIAGAEATVAVGLARLGHRSAWFGRLGADALGEVVLRGLRAEGVDTTHVIRDPEGPTGILIRDCHADRPIDVTYHRTGSAGSRLRVSDVDVGWIPSACILHVSGITAMLSESSRAACLQACRTAKAAGVTVSFDPNLRSRLAPFEEWVGPMAELFALADIVTLGSDELNVLTSSDDASELIERGARLVVVKAGSAGATATTSGGERLHTPAHPIVVVDPVGAGDAFTAGLLSATLRRLPLARALEEASIVAALCVAVPGDLTGLPDAPTRDALVSAARSDLTIRR